MTHENKIKTTISKFDEEFKNDVKISPQAIQIIENKA